MARLVLNTSYNYEELMELEPEKIYDLINELERKESLLKNNSIF